MGDLIQLSSRQTQHPSILVPVYAPDGRRLHRFRQSSLKDIDLCMERARRNMAGLMPESTKAGNDATELGTAVHEAIELCLESMLAGQGPLTEDDMNYLARDVFYAASEVEGFVWAKAKSYGTVYNRIDACLSSWYRLVLPTLEPAATELSWGPLVIHEDDDRIIELTGTIDYIDAVEGPADWKTSGRKWEKWEHDRWDIQPTCYTWALDQMAQQGQSIPWSVNRGPVHSLEPWPFAFHVMQTDGGYEKIVVYRHSGDWSWLKERVLVVAELIEAELDQWALNDNHALCSPTWCPVWSDCKGKHYQSGWPKPSLPA